MFGVPLTDDDVLWWRGHAPINMIDPHVATEKSDWGIEKKEFVARVKSTSLPYCLCKRYRSGWPLRSLTGATWIDFRPTWNDDGPEVHRSESLINRSFDGIPYRPIFSGFAINTIFYAVILWMLCAAPGAVRRRVRIKSGQCASCGYSLRESVSEKCPECGATLKQKAETQKA